MGNEAKAEAAIASGDSAENEKPSSVAEIIRDMNEGTDSDVMKNDSSASDQPDGKTTTKTDKPAPGNKDTAASAASKEPAAGATDGNTDSPEDPAFAKGAEPSETESDDSNKAGQKTSDLPKDEKDDEVVEKAFTSRMSALTQGTIKSEEDFREMVERYNELSAQAEEGFKPKFRNDRHKQAFEMLANVPEGKEIETTKRTLHALSLEPDKLKGKSLLFEAYLLDPENSDLSRDKAEKYFEAEWEKNYANAETDITVERELQKAEKRAKDLIEKTQGEFLKESAKDPDEPQGLDPKVVENIKKATKSFGGAILSFSEDAPENEQLKIPLEDPTELQTLERDLLSPHLFWKDMVSQHMDDKGNVDMDALALSVWKFKNLQKIEDLIFKHGIEVANRRQFNKDRNSSTQSEKVKDNARIPAGGKKEAKSFVGAFQEALEGKH